MKQLPMTPQLSDLIHLAVGPDVETANLAVFEAISLNNAPLPGKNGTIFENAVVMPITLRQMADSIAGGNHLPLISDHQMMGEPKGRVFAAELTYNQDAATSAGDLELRTLFYLDPTETVLIAKLNSGSLDEVSVSFLSTEFNCSECGWDYFGPELSATALQTRTCDNGHVIGTDGVHAEMVGLSKFVELSLVARGAAYKPKIVGKSASKLQPPSSMRLAAAGVEIDGLICQASLGEDIVTMDTNKLLTDLVEAKTSVAVLTATNGTLSAQVLDGGSKFAASEAKVVELTASLALAEAKPNNEADYQVALTFLGEVLVKLTTAAGEAAPAELPKTVADLKVAIEAKTSKLTAILPVGGVAASADDDSTKVKPAFPRSAFSNRKIGN
jgi:hypothetical protein